MSGISRNGHSRRMPGAKASAIPKDDVIDQCLKSVIVDHRLRHRPRYPNRSDTESSDVKNSKSTLLHKGASMISIADIIGQGSAKKSQKFPSQLTKALALSLQRVVMRKEPDYDELQVRSTFGAFYSYYISEAFQKSMKDNRKIEDLILMFFSKATGELQKRLPEDEVKRLVNQHVAKFVRLILKVTRENKLATSDSDFVIKLTGYESKLLRNSDVLDPVEQPLDPPGQSKDSFTPSLSQIPSARALQEVFHVDSASLQTKFNHLLSQCTIEAALRDLKTQLHFVSSQSGPSYKVSDFDSGEKYSVWKQQEITYLTKAILKITTSNPVLASLRNADRTHSSGQDGGARSRSNSSSSDLSERARRNTEHASSSRLNAAESLTTDESQLLLVPHDKFIFYREFLKVCLDFELAGDRFGASTSPDLTKSTIFGRDTLDLLKLCRDWWRITNARHTANYLEVCTSRFVDSKVSLEVLDEALAEIKELKEANESAFTMDDKEIYKQAIKLLNENLFRDLYAELQFVYSRKIDTRVITIIEDHIHTDSFFLEAAPETSSLFDQMEEGLREAAAEAYTVLRAKILGKQDLEVLAVVKLADSLCKEIRRFRMQFKHPIMDLIDIWQIYLRTTVPYILSDVPTLMAKCYHLTRAQNAEFALEDMFQLYEVISQLHEYAHRFCVDTYQSPVSIDQYFRPVVLKWLSNAHSAIVELVPRVLSTDSFLLEVVAGEETAVCSPSITLLFKSFNQHLKFLRELEWPDEYWSAKFVTQLSRSFSEALRNYCNQLERLFSEEISSSSDQIEVDEMESLSLQQRLIAKARDAITKKEHVEPFHILPTACVKLNNVEWAKEHLDMLERSVDSATTAEVIQKYEGPKPAWIPGRKAMFSIKVISAENLRPCDSNGYSDPYVVLSDQTGRRVAKTRTIYTNLNPRWNQTFDVPSTEALWLAATVWDRDTKGEHDICGRCYFKLDPRYFDDCLPKDFHLNLDTQGILHLRITTESESDDATFYFGRAFRFLGRAENDMTRSIVDKMTPFINISLSRSSLRSLFSKPITIDSTLGSAYSLLNKAGFATPRPANIEKLPKLSNREMEAPIDTLMQYLDNNFKVLDQSLTRSAFNMVMSKLWKYVIMTLEDLIIPPLFSGPLKIRRPLREAELDVVYKWLGFLKDTFAGDGGGLSEEELQTTFYHELLSIRFFYFDPVDDLIRECDRIAATHSEKKEQRLDEYKRPKVYNLGTIKKAKDKSTAVRRLAGNSEDIILRVLRLRDSEDAKTFIELKLHERVQAARKAVAEAGMDRQTTTRSSHQMRH